VDYARYEADLKDLRRRNVTLGAAVSGLTLALLVALGTILKIAGSERTVIVPPRIEQGFWITSAQGSKDYLNQMGAYFAYLILDVDADTIEWKKSALLDWISPAQHGLMKTRQDLEAARLRRNNAATYFRPQQLVPDEARQSVVVMGRLRTTINGVETSNEVKSYLVELDFTGGRAHLKTFKEVLRDPQAPALPAVSAVPDAR
jgi:conjugal transfer pilus assembly protein TraE